MELMWAWRGKQRGWDQNCNGGLWLPTIPDLPGHSWNWPTNSRFCPEIFHKNLAEPSFHNKKNLVKFLTVAIKLHCFCLPQTAGRLVSTTYWKSDPVNWCIFTWWTILPYFIPTEFVWRGLAQQEEQD